MPNTPQVTVSLLRLIKSPAKIFMTSLGQNNRKQQKQANNNDERSRKCKLWSGQIRLLYQEKKKTERRINNTFFTKALPKREQIILLELSTTETRQYWEIKIQLEILGQEHFLE